MQKDKKQTKVLFVKELESVLAIFPKQKYGFNGYRNDLITCYSHIGQHSGCAPEYVINKLPAKKEEYKDLSEELENLGYNLKILNKN